MSLSPSLRSTRLNLRCLAIGLGLAMLAFISPATAADADLPLIIQVRSDVDQPFEGWGKAEIKEHGKVYALVSIEEMNAEEKLIKPVNEAEMLKVLHAELAKKGFKRTTPDLKPDVAITVNYGRGWLRNPYQDDMIDYGATNPPTFSMAGILPTQLMRRKQLGFENKLQNANFEKLYIHIMAWEYPKEPPSEKFKPKLLWNTTILTDSPEDRDLNQFFPKMLAAGAGFFDRRTENEEAEIRDDMPVDQVILGDMKVLKEGDPDLELQSDRKQKNRVK